MLEGLEHPYLRALAQVRLRSVISTVFSLSWRMWGGMPEGVVSCRNSLVTMFCVSGSSPTRSCAGGGCQLRLRAPPPFPLPPVSLSLALLLLLPLDVHGVDEFVGLRPRRWSGR